MFINVQDREATANIINYSTVITLNMTMHISNVIY